MRFFHSIGQFWQWLFAVLGVFIRTHPVLTPVLIVSHALAGIARLLAFFIPLKVLLLIATPGVPRYFRYFIEPEYRVEWAVGLTIGAVAAYFLAVLLDKLCDYWSGIGSRELLEKSSQLSIIGNQRERARGYFSDFTGQAADLLLAVVFFSVGGFFYPTLFAGLAGLILLLFLISWLALLPVEPTQPRGFGGYILRNTGSYLGYLEALCFLGGFAYLVLDFLFFDGVNVLIAILSFLMLRRLLGVMSSLVSGAVSLSGQRHRIDPLVFMEEKYRRKQPDRQQRLLRHFTVGERQERLQNLLQPQVRGQIAFLASRWLDPGPPGMYLFDVSAYGDEGERLFHGQEQVSGRNRKDPLENEALIIEYLGVGRLNMAPVVLEYQAGDFDCRVLDLDKAEAVAGSTWKHQQQPLLMRRLWAVDPGRELKAIFEQSRHYLPERVLDEELAKMEVAVDCDDKAAIWQVLKNKMPVIRKAIGSLPVFPFNQGLSPKTVFVSKDGEFLITDWGRWSLEPVGVGLDPGYIDEDLVASLAAQLRKQKRGLPVGGLEAMRIAARAFLFEAQLVKRGAFNEALNLSERLLEDLEAWQAAVEDKPVGEERGNA